METKVNKTSNVEILKDLSLNKFKDMDFFPEKTNKFNEMVARIGEDKFVQFTGAKKRI
jgi:hypothetical protein